MATKQKRPGRLAEEIVARLEQALGPDVSVVSPDSVLGVLSGKQREIDIAVRGKVGSVEVFVMIECRDRKTRQGVEWIEQLVQKARDVGAGKVIAVSTSGFTKPARELARSNAVLLRTLDTIDAEGIAQWFVSAQLSLCFPRFRLLVGTRTDGTSFVDRGGPGGPIQRADEPLFRIPGIPTFLSLRQILESLAQEHDWSELPQDLRGDGSAPPCVFQLAAQSDPVELHLDGTPVLLNRLAICVEFEIRPVPLELADARQYKEVDGVVAQISRYEHHWPGGYTFLEIAELPPEGNKYLWDADESKNE